MEDLKINPLVFTLIVVFVLCLGLVGGIVFAMKFFPKILKNLGKEMMKMAQEGKDGKQMFADVFKELNKLKGGGSFRF